MLLALSGCGPELRPRTDQDLLRIDPKEAARLADVRFTPDYSPCVTERTAWQTHTSLSNREALTDGDLGTAATSSDDHRQGEWILVDLGRPCHLQRVHQRHPAAGGEPPRYRVDVAGDHGFPYSLEFVGCGEPGESVAVFPRPVDARFIRLTVIEDSAAAWQVSELVID
jgi:hypothetical protein